MRELLVPQSRAKQLVITLFDQYQTEPLDINEDHRPPDHSKSSTRLPDGREVDVLWIERFDAMFDDQSIILGEAVNAHRETIPIVWHPNKESWISFDSVSIEARDEVLSTG